MPKVNIHDETPLHLRKWWWSFLSTVVVAVVMLPFTYSLVDSIVHPLTGL